MLPVDFCSAKSVGIVGLQINVIVYYKYTGAQVRVNMQYINRTKNEFSTPCIELAVTRHDKLHCVITQAHPRNFFLVLLFHMLGTRCAALYKQVHQVRFFPFNANTDMG